MKKREKYENTLKKVEILKSIDPYEFGQICDDLKSVNYKAGDIIIKQNDIGDIFYIVDEGKVHDEKVFEPGKPPQNVKDYGSATILVNLLYSKENQKWQLLSLILIADYYFLIVWPSKGC